MCGFSYYCVQLVEKCFGGSGKSIYLCPRMLKIMAIMGAGALLGFFARRLSVLKHLGTTSMATIILLLFLMGVEIGGNERIVQNLTSLGVEALVIAVAATLGSIVAARIVYYKFFNRQRHEE